MQPTPDKADPASLGDGYIELHHFLAGMLSGVGHLGSYRNLAAIKHRILRCNLKAGIAQSKAEGEHGIFVHRIEISVANIDALTVVVSLGSPKSPTWQ